MQGDFVQRQLFAEFDVCDIFPDAGSERCSTRIGVTQRSPFSAVCLQFRCSFVKVGFVSHQVDATLADFKRLTQQRFAGCPQRFRNRVHRVEISFLKSDLCFLIGGHADLIRQRVDLTVETFFVQVNVGQRLVQIGDRIANTGFLKSDAAR